MTRFGFALVILLSPLALCAEDKKPVSFTSKEGKFTVAVPEKPSSKTSKVPSDAGPIEVHMFVVDQKDRAYIMSYNDYPPASVGNAEKMMNTVIEGNAKSLKGKVVADEKITIGKKNHPGRAITIEIGGDKKQIYKARVYLVGNRLYQVVALGPDDFAESKIVEDYLKSFTIEE
jgi:hypothetical protein